MKSRITMNKNKKKFEKIRKCTWELFAQKQIPSRLCFAICESDNLHDEIDVQFFIEATKELMRVRGFYADKVRNSQMNEEFSRLFDEYKKKRKEEVS